MAMDILTKDILSDIGFKPLPYASITGSMNYALGRDRILTVSCVGTPNEMLFIGQLDENNEKKINDIIVLHNYDYDGYLEKEKLELLISVIGKSEKSYKK